MIIWLLIRKRNIIVIKIFFKDNSYVNKLFYSNKEKSFIFGNMNHFTQKEFEENPIK